MSRQTASRWIVYTGNPEAGVFSESVSNPPLWTVYSGNVAKSKACEKRSFAASLFYLTLTC